MCIGANAGFEKISVNILLKTCCALFLNIAYYNISQIHDILFIKCFDDFVQTLFKQKYCFSKHDDNIIH